MSRILALKRFTKATTILISASVAYSSISFNQSSTDPLDCQVPACSDKLDMFRKATKAISKPKQTSADKEKEHVTGIPQVYEGCPLDRSELGKSSWDLLHTIAANYPDQPSEEQQRQMTAFIEGLAVFYPCIHCAKDFQANVALSPPRVSSRKELSLWMCEQHNEVNEKMGYPAFPCELALLDERWRVSKRRQCRTGPNVAAERSSADAATDDQVSSSAQSSS